MRHPELIAGGVKLVNPAQVITIELCKKGVAEAEKMQRAFIAIRDRGSHDEIQESIEKLSSNLHVILHDMNRLQGQSMAVQKAIKAVKRYYGKWNSLRLANFLADVFTMLQMVDPNEEDAKYSLVKTVHEMAKKHLD